MYHGNGDFITLSVIAVFIGIVWYVSSRDKQEQRAVDSVHAKYHFNDMLKLSYREDEGETLTPHEKHQLEEARALECEERGVLYEPPPSIGMSDTEIAASQRRIQ